MDLEKKLYLYTEVYPNGIENYLKLNLNLMF